MGGGASKCSQRLEPELSESGRNSTQSGGNFEDVLGASRQASVKFRNLVGDTGEETIVEGNRQAGEQEDIRVCENITKFQGEEQSLGSRLETKDLDTSNTERQNIASWHKSLQEKVIEGHKEPFGQHLQNLGTQGVKQEVLTSKMDDRARSGEVSRMSGESTGARIAHASSFFSPSSAGGSLDIDRTGQPRRSGEAEEPAASSAPQSKGNECDRNSREVTENVPSTGASRPPDTHVRVSMDIAGGQHAAWSGNVGTPERMSLQIRAAEENAPRQSDISSTGTIEDLPQSLLTSIPPPPPPYPPAKPPDSMIGSWGPGKDDKDRLEEKDKDRMRAELNISGGSVHQSVLHGVSRLEVTSDHGSDAFSDGAKSKAVRSSFAAERKSMDVTKDESSLDMFRSIADDGTVSRLNSETLPSELRRRYHQLAVLPAEAPVPILLLARIWGSTNLSDTEAAASLMEAKRILKMAVLEDDTAWVMVSPFHLARLQKKFESSLPQMHSRIVNLYWQGYHDLALVPDDHYFMQNIAHHLVESGRLEELGGILRDPIWLETKLRSYGPGAVVNDFRRLLVASDDPDIKLLLRAFQISATASLDHPNLYILKEQMLARLMVAASGTSLGAWYETARSECWLAVPHRRARNMPVHLLPRTPTLEQAGGLQRLILKGHTEGIRKVMLVPNGTEVVTASADGSMRLWDMEIGDCVLFMEEHEAAVTCIAITQDGQTLISGAEDCLAIVFDLPSGVWKHKLRGHSKRVNAVAVDSQGRRVVSSSQDMTTRIWSLSKGTCLHVLTDFVGGQGFTWENWAGHHTVAISPDCRLVATADGEYRVRVWKMETGELADTLEGHSDWVVAVVFAGDSGKLVTASHDKTVRVWDLWTGVSEQVFSGHRGRINNLRVTPDGRRAVSVSDDSVAIMWDLETGTKKNEFLGHSAWINDAAVTYNASKVITASGDELAVVWDAASGEVLQVLKGHSGEINSVDVSYKGRFAITASEDGTARVWDLQAPAVAATEHHQGKVTRAIVSPNSHYCVTIGEDNTALVWDVEHASCKHMLQGHQTGLNWAFIVADGQQLVTASGDRRVCIWDLESGECIRTLSEHRGSRMKSFAVSKDGKRAIIVLFDSTVSVWDLESMSCVGWLIRRGERDGVRVHSGGVNGVYICRHGSQAVTISKDATARLWEIDSGECIMVLKGHEDVVTAAVVKEDGSQCLTAGYDKTARLWDLKTGECTMVLDHPSHVDHIAVDDKWQRAVSIAESTTAWLWDIKRGRCLGVLEGHTDEISGACFSEDGRFVATYSANSVIRVWTAHSGRLRAVFLGDSGFTTSHFCTYGKIDTLVAGDGHGVVHFLEFPANDLTSAKKR